MDEGADFIDCVAWGKTAENMQRYLNKGSKVLVLGRLSKRSYEDRNGNKRSLTEVVAENVEFLDSIKGYLNRSFSMKDLGEAAYILGIKMEMSHRQLNVQS